jgi:hypothetical protein
VDDEYFLAGRTDTGFLGRMNQKAAADADGEEEIAAIAAAIWQSLESRNDRRERRLAVKHSAWKQAARNEAIAG